MPELNKQQQEAVNCNAPKIVCLAGAGTGKTFTLIERIARIARETNRPDQILALTFTNAAAFEMRDRYKRNFPGVITPEFRTFHSFCYSLICEDNSILKKLGYSKVPKVADEGAAKRAETKAKLQLNVKLSQGKLEGRQKLTPKEQFIYDSYRQAVKRLLVKGNTITFNTMSESICKLFTANDESIQKYKNKYKYIFVDEFQDTDPEQWEFVKSFTNSNIFVCGDALQAIYGFRGADSSIIKELSKSEEWTPIKLYQNYRSTKQICNFANNMSDYADPEYRIEIDSNKLGCNVDVTTCENIPYMQTIDKECLNKILESSQYTEGTSAILCRTNKEVAGVANYLKSAGTSFDLNVKDNDAENIIKSVLDSNFMADWLSTYLNAEQYAEYIRECTVDKERSSLKILIDSHQKNWNIGYRFKSAIVVRKIIKNKDLTIEDKARSILEVLGIKDIDIVITDEIKSAKDLLEFCLSKIQYLNQTGLYVGTVHSVKGLEYDNVYVYGPGGYSWSLKGEQEKNLYYVAITRAKNKLFIYKGDWRDE